MASQTFGIIGYGHFGAFLARSFKRHGQVLVTDADTDKLPTRNGSVRAASIEEIARADVVVAAVPFTTLAATLKELRDLLPPKTVVMDVVSTKARSTQLFEEILAEHPNLIASHPLFGPPSMKKLQPGQRLVVTLEKGKQAAKFRRFLEKTIGLEVISLSAEEHDRAMAYMQALPFFIARALVEIDVLDLPHRELLAIPSFEKLASIAMIEEHHTDDMFDTSQRSNPFAEEARQMFLQVLTRLHEEIGIDGEPILTGHHPPAPDR